MSKAYIFLADGFEEVEGLTVVDLLRRAGIDIRMVSIMDSVKVTGSHDITVKADALFTETDFSGGDMFILPGGQPGTTNLGKHEALGRLLKEENEKGTALAAICAAPMVFGGLGILNGRKAICYPGCEGALTGAAITRQKVVTDGHITTSMGPGSAMAFSLELIRILCGEEKAAEIKKGLCYGHLS